MITARLTKLSKVTSSFLPQRGDHCARQTKEKQSNQLHLQLGEHCARQTKISKVINSFPNEVITVPDRPKQAK